MSTNFSGTFAEIGKGHGSQHVSGDFTVDGHNVVVRGQLESWSQHPEIAALLLSWGWNGTAIDHSADGDVMWLRQHKVPGGTASMIRALWDRAGELGLRPGADAPADGDASQPYPGAPSVPDLLAWLQQGGLIMASTPEKGPLPSQLGFVERFYAAKDDDGAHLVLGVNAEPWLWEKHGRRLLPEQWAVREDGVALWVALERAIAGWGLAVSGGHPGNDNLPMSQEEALAAYDAFEPAFVPVPGQVSAPITYGDRACNPRSVIYAGRFVRDAIVRGNPQAAALHCPRAAMTLGQPQVASKYDLWSFGTQQLTARDWRSVLNLPLIDGDGSSDGLNVGRG